MGKKIITKGSKLKAQDIALIASIGIKEIEVYEKLKVGIFTTGKGVTVHRRDCDNLSNFSDVPELWMDVAWEHEGPRRVMARLNTVLSNEPGSLAAVATIIGQQGGNISNIHLTDRNADFFSFELDLEVKDVEHMRTIVTALQANNFVERVARAQSA